MRLNQYLASCGLGSRRSCENLIREGLVEINGDCCVQLSRIVELSDLVRFRGKVVRPKSPLTIILNKPRGYTTARTERNGTIYDLLPQEWRHLRHVGRLDKESQGLILLTNDGTLAHALSHPTSGVEKQYEVITNRPLLPTAKSKLLKGFRIESGFAKVNRLKVLAKCHFLVTLKQGLNRQIRLMFAEIGSPVSELTRVRIGKLGLCNLSSGRWRVLGDVEVRSLQEASQILYSHPKESRFEKFT